MEYKHEGPLLQGERWEERVKVVWTEEHGRKSGSTVDEERGEKRRGDRSGVIGQSRVMWARIEGQGNNDNLLL